jgi:hypothetical protein
MQALHRILLTAGLTLAGAAWLAAQAEAQTTLSTAGAPEAPTRAARLVTPQAGVWVYDTEQGHWVEGGRNRALTEGDRVQTDRDARAELRLGSTDLRLAGASEIEFDRLDDERTVVKLLRGSLALRLRSGEAARETSVVTGEGRWWPERAGHYRIDRDHEATSATVWAGGLSADPRGDDSSQKFQVRQGQRVEVYLQMPERAPVVSWSSPAADRFGDWALAEAAQGDRSASQRYASPEMTGIDDLDRHGRWERHPDYGMVWTPLSVSIGWAPYRHGRWYWHARWGWTWQDDAPWGFAPFHYGRWVHWGNRWCWWPGQMVARPVFAPALVAWVGGSHGGVSLTIGGGSAVGWLPLAPYDLYVPHFRHHHGYYERVNRPYRPHQPGGPGREPVPPVPTGPIMYGNKGVPNAVTVVSSDVLRQRQPVQTHVVRDSQVVQQAVQQVGGPSSPSTNWRADSPVAAVRSVPGGAVSVQPHPSNASNPPGQAVRPVNNAPQAAPQPVPGAPKLGPRPPGDDPRRAEQRAERNDARGDDRADSRQGAGAREVARPDNARRPDSRERQQGRDAEPRHNKRDKDNAR